jgi:opacity protein-like surface antigen
MNRNYNKYHLSTKLIALIFAMGLIFICSSAYCQEDDPCVKKEPVDDKWNFMVTPYFNANSLDVVSTINGVEADVDLDFSDIIDDFDVWGVATRVDARKGKSKWGLFLDGWYLDLESDFKLNHDAIDKVEVDISQGQVDLAVTYRLFKGLPMKKVGCYLPLSLDVWGGARYAYLKQKIKPESNIPAVPRTLGKSKDWVEPLVGARIQFPVTKKLTLHALGDVSGFGVGSASDRTWSCTAGFDYQLFEKVSFKLGYKYYDIKYSNGSGTSKFGLDGTEQGPWLGITFHL